MQENHYEILPIQIYNFISKNWQFEDKTSDIFHNSAQNIDCGYSLEPPRWGGSNEYPQSMFLSRNKKNNIYPRKPQFYYIKMGFNGVNIRDSVITKHFEYNSRMYNSVLLVISYL